MILDIAIYPPPSLPFGLKLQLLWHRLLQNAVTGTTVDSDSSVVSDRKFNELIARENAAISKICFSFAGSVAEFEDLRQDALINIWRGMHNFRCESSERTWIYRVTVNSCISAVRRQSRHRHESLEGLYGLIESDDTDKEAVEQLHHTIGTLAPEEKAVIMMWLDELSYDDIAAAMGMNRNTVASKIKRIKDKIVKRYKI